MNIKILKQDSELLGLFNYHFSKLEESGVFRKIKDKWFDHHDGDDGGGKDEGRRRDMDASVLGYASLPLPFALVACGMVMAATAAVVERAAAGPRMRGDGNAAPERTVKLAVAGTSVKKVSTR